jgi:hypothetical protein
VIAKSKSNVEIRYLKVNIILNSSFLKEGEYLWPKPKG